VIKEESQHLTRSSKKLRQHRSNYDGTIGNGIKKCETGVQVNQSIYFRNSVFVDETIENCSSV
jgi:hypothetical protein